MCLLPEGCKLPALIEDDIIVRVGVEPVEASNGYNTVQLENCLLILRPLVKKQKKSARGPAGCSSALVRARPLPLQPLPLFVKIANFNVEWLAPVHKLTKTAAEGSSSFMNVPTDAPLCG